MLFQIQEPDQNKKAESEENPSYPLAIGIDLGTTNSLVAWAVKGHVESLKTNDIIPSCVAYIPEGIVVGDAALALQGRDHTTVLQSVKRLMGKTAVEEYAGAFPFAVDQEAHTMPRLVTARGIVTPVEVSAAILAHLKTQAEQQLEKTVTKAVITVPAYFDEAAKMATKQAAQLAGLEVLRLLNEPTAAALAYGLDNHCEGVYIVYDLGGGTFDVSLLNLVQGVFQVIATKGDGSLGGDDIDRCLVEHFRSSRQQQGMTEQWEFPQYQEVCQAAAHLKEKLSFSEHADLSLTIKGNTSHHHVTRDQFNHWIMPLVERTLHIFQEVILEKPKGKEIKGVILVGGTTRVPLIRTEIQKLFDFPLLTNIDPDRVVAWGAALQAAALTEGSDTLLLDIVPLSLGIETMGGLVDRIIPRNTPIPTQKTQQFTTFADSQQGILLNIVQGERETADDCRSLARFEVKNIPPLPAGKARIEVTFKVDADGLLTVCAVEKETGQRQTVDVKPLYGLSQEDIQRILLNSLQYQQSDQQQRQVIEQKLKIHSVNEADSLQKAKES